MANLGMANLGIDFVVAHMRRSLAVKEALVEDAARIALIAEVGQKLIGIYRKGGKLLLAGNGGSAADAQHIAAEMVSRFEFDRPGLPAIALTTDTSALTAIGNDYGFEHLFRRQLEANGAAGDAFIAISTSGNSPNIVEALKICRDRKILAVGLTGDGGGKMAPYCDYCIRVPSTSTPRIQESHILIGHILCAMVEEALFGRMRAKG